MIPISRSLELYLIAKVLFLLIHDASKFLEYKKTETAMPAPVRSYNFNFLPPNTPVRSAAQHRGNPHMPQYSQ